MTSTGARAPRLLQPLVAAWLARGIVRLARHAPTGARFGLHLCLGDMNHEALGRMHDVRPLVLLTNAITDRWPHRQPLEYVHVPLAAGLRHRLMRWRMARSRGVVHMEVVDA